MVEVGAIIAVVGLVITVVLRVLALILGSYQRGGTMKTWLLIVALALVVPQVVQAQSAEPDKCKALIESVGTLVQGSLHRVAGMVGVGLVF